MRSSEVVVVPFFVFCVVGGSVFFLAIDAVRSSSLVLGFVAGVRLTLGSQGERHAFC